jgi:hypothetical protein
VNLLAAAMVAVSLGAGTLADEPPVIVREVGGLSQDTLSAVEQIAGLVGAEWTVVDQGMLRLLGVTRGGEDVQRPEPGFGYPMAVAVADPAVADILYGPGVGDVLGRGELVMSTLSARMRGAEVGDVVELEGWNGTVMAMTIGAVVPDPVLGWQEILLPVDAGRTLGLRRPAWAAIWDADDAGLLRSGLDAFLPEGPIVVVHPGEPTRVRDRTLPQVLVKLRFGEFSFAFAEGDRIDVEDAWERDNIVWVEHPRLGRFRCNRHVVPYLEAALREVERLRIDWMLDTGDFQRAGGCYNPRLMRGSDQGFALSRHAWGIAVDINPSTNPYGGPVRLDPRIGNAFRRWGFAWGAGWTVPDGMHFEWVTTPLDEDMNLCFGPVLGRFQESDHGYPPPGSCSLE